MDLVQECHSISKTFPREKLFGIASQIRRAAVSVPANIAEGFGRWHRKEYAHHLRMAAGSVAELETHLSIALRLKYMEKVRTEALLRRAEEIGKMIAGLLKALSRMNPSP